MDLSHQKSVKSYSKRNKGSSLNPRNEQELDFSFKFNPEDILTRWPLLYKFENQDHIELIKYRSKLEEHTIKLAEPRKIFTHLFNPNVKL
jgi:hypothetical protein